MKSAKQVRVVSLLILWAFGNLYLLIYGIVSREGSLFTYKRFFPEYRQLMEVSIAPYFYPFDRGVMDFKAYDITELFLYVGIPVLAYYLYQYNKIYIR